MTDKESSDLRESASNVLSDLDKIRLDRPFFFEFSGSPKSGKSTCIDIVAHFFRRLGYRVLAPTEGASKRTPYYLKEDLVAFNAWSACYAIMHVLESLYHSDKYHLAILDRGLFDALTWFEFLAERSELPREECDLVHKFLLLDKWRASIDGVFLFMSDPETSMSRENRDKIISDTGRAMNPDTLEALNRAYEQVKQTYAAEFPMFEVVETSEVRGTSPRSTAAEVVTSILDVLERKTQ